MNHYEQAAEDNFYGRSSVALDAAIFDFVLFDHLTMGEVVLQREVIQLFKLQIEQTSAAMTGLDDKAAWASLAHTLRGSAAAVGATAIANLARNWENVAELPNAGRRVAFRELLAIQAEQYFANVDRVFASSAVRRTAVPVAR
jgi:HPt (histidine-containing phosphotransfer) domain-containing protein